MKVRLLSASLGAYLSGCDRVADMRRPGDIWITGIAAGIATCFCGASTLRALSKTTVKQIAVDADRLRSGEGVSIAGLVHVAVVRHLRHRAELGGHRRRLVRRAANSRTMPLSQTVNRPAVVFLAMLLNLLFGMKPICPSIIAPNCGLSRVTFVTK